MLPKNIFSFNIKWDYKHVSLFIFLLILPNLLSMINIGTIYGFKLHFFQVAIFLAAILYGPKGGLISGFIGSFYSSIIMNNPYLIIGNMILGFFTGLFIRYKMHTILAVILAFIIQLPWLIITDYYLVSLSAAFIIPLIVALAISNVIWATAAHFSTKILR